MKRNLTNDELYKIQLSGRRPDKLKPLNRTPEEVNFAIYDIEASDWVNHVLSGYYDGINLVYFYSIDEFIDFINTRIVEDIVIYCHNGGGYDFRFLFNKLKFENVQMLEIGGSIATINFNNSMGYKIEFRDSLKILPFSLDKLAKDFDVETKKGSIDYNNIVLNQELHDYLRDDLKANYQVIDKFQKELNALGGELKITAASCAMDYFRRKHLKYPLITYHHRDEVLREAYYGGRTEVKKRYGRDLFYYDINSLYPSVMATERFPIGLPTYYNHGIKFNKNDLGVAKISTFIPKGTEPFLPYRYGKSLLFPTGYLKGFYPLPFLEELKNQGIDFRIHEMYLFDGDYLFKDFVETLYKIRQDNKGTARDKVTKLMMNSLYGKFGQSSEKTTLHINPTIDFIEGRDLPIIYSGDNIELRSETYNLFSKNTMVGIASYVTAYAQLKLYEGMKSVNGDWYYADTDSLITPKCLPNSTELGAWGLEDEIKEGAFLGQKIYSYLTPEGDIKIRYKGYPRDLLRKDDPEEERILHLEMFKEMKKAIYSGSLDYFEIEFQRLWGMREGFVRKEGVINESSDFLKYGHRKKSLNKVDTKRIFRGIETESFHFNKSGEIENG